MSASPIETKCQLAQGHEGDHNPIYEVHKCYGFEDCPWCISEEDRCEYEQVTVQVWVREEK